MLEWLNDYGDVSIHAPGEGSDGQVANELRSSQFQSTLPAKGATKLFAETAGYVMFQSTLPAKGATSTGWAQR